MVEHALRGVVRQALEVVAERGLPGAHHFYLTFLTAHPGVEMSEALRARFPKDMTIVLQFEFWGLEVEAERFAVTLSFNARHERLSIPFAAVTGFADPSVKFGLQFEASESDVAEGAGPLVATDQAPRIAPLGEAKNAPAAGTDGETPDGATEQPKTADVVTLDAFRKK
jgi:hypothetical protein